MMIDGHIDVGYDRGKWESQISDTRYGHGDTKRLDI